MDIISGFMMKMTFKQIGVFPVPSHT